MVDRNGKKSKLVLMSFDEKGSWGPNFINTKCYMECLGMKKGEHYKTLNMENVSDLIKELSMGVGLAIPDFNKLGLLPSGILIGYPFVVDFLDANKEYIK